MNFFNYYSPADEGGLIWTPTEATVVELTPVPMPTKVSNAWPKGVVPLNDGGLLLKAGTPLYVKSGAWVPSNSSTSGKRIIVAKDYAYHPSDPIQNCLVPCITKGFVDQARAEAAYGYSYANADKTGFGSQGIVLAAADFGSGGGLPEYSGYFANPFLGIYNGNPHWYGLEETVPSIVNDRFIGWVADTLDEAEQSYVWSGSDAAGKYVVAAVFHEHPEKEKMYYLDETDTDPDTDESTYTFRPLSGSDYFTYTVDDGWTYHAGT